MSFDLKLENGDIQIASDGSLRTVYNEDKLRQDVIKMLLTPIGSHKLFPWYGSPLTDRTLGKVLPANILDTEITNAISYSLNNLMSLQEEQERGGQYVSPAEAIAVISDVASEVSYYDPRQYNLRVSILNKRRNIVEEAFNLRL